MKTQFKLVVLLLSLVCIGVNSQIVVYPNNNVGIKTTTAPTQALEVNGTVKATSFSGDGSLLTNLAPWSFGTSKIYYNSGNVGIGTTTPLSPLSLNGTGNSLYTLYTYNSLTTSGASAIYASSEAPSTSGYIKYGVYSDCKLGVGSSYGVYGNAYSSGTTTGYAYGVYGRAGNGAAGHNFGVLGILSGNVYGSGICGLAPGYSEPSASAQYAGYFGGVVYVNGSIGVGRIPSYLLDVNGTIRVGSSTYTSDARLKDSIKTITGALNNIKYLQGVTYKIKLSESLSSTKITNQQTDQDYIKRGHIGFLAQDVKKVFPELVYEDNDGILSVDYVSMIPMLVESIKELNAKVDKLEAENADLKKKLKIE